MRLFPSRRRQILWFSRGNGRGHATMDLAILEQMHRSRGRFSVRFVSYDSGARMLSQMGHPVIDLCLPAHPPFWEVLAQAGLAMAQTRPDLVVCHEEFAPLVLAKLLGLPTLFITHWFWNPADLAMQTLAFADEVIFVDEAGAFEEPPYVRGRVSYVGPVLRSFNYTRRDRGLARTELGLPADALVISVFPGSWTEEMVPIYDLVSTAYSALDHSEKRLIWIAGQDFALIGERATGDPTVTVIDFEPQIDRLMCASDLAITKANYTTVKELAALGIPSVSLSCGINPIDEIYATRVATNVPLDRGQVNPEQLAEQLKLLWERSLAPPTPTALPVPNGPGKGAAGAAARLVHYLDRSQTGADPRPPSLQLTLARGAARRAAATWREA